LGDGTLHADGTVLRDTAGRAVHLRGVNMGARSKWAPFAPFDFEPGGYQAALDAYLDRAQSWGINVARVPFTWEAVEPTQGTDDAEFLARYDALLDGLWKRGIRSIIDFHQDVYAHVYCGDGFPAWTLAPPHPAPHHDCANWTTGYLADPLIRGAFDRFWAAGSPVQSAYVSMWERMARRYGSKPGVIGFELINEPGWGTADLKQWEKEVLTPFFTATAARVRAVAPSSLIFFEGSGADALFNVTSIDRPGGEGLVYMPHYYQLASRPEAVAGDLKYFAGRGKAWNVPVILGEFGVAVTEPLAEPLMSAHWDALEALGMGGTEWEYSASPELWNAERFSLAEADGTQNVTARAIVRPYLVALAGSDVSVSREAGMAEWRYTGGDGVTELSLPSGGDVEVVGACADVRSPGRVLLKADSVGQPVRVRVRSR
jgi:endoglycosylceramidase